MIGQVRISRPAILLNGKDYFPQLTPYFVGLVFEDNCDGERADDFQMMLDDRDHKFINEWSPDKGSYLDVSIICERWYSPLAPNLSLDCGRFWIDELEFQIPQHTLAIKATSIPTDMHAKNGLETRGWEGASLKDIATQIAKENSMTLLWDSDVNPTYKRVEQTEQNALRFLLERTREIGLSMKCCRGQIIIYNEEAYEKKDPVFAVVFGDEPNDPTLPTYRMGSGQFNSKIGDSLKHLVISHVNPETGRITNGEFGDNGNEDDTFIEGGGEDPVEGQQQDSAPPDSEEDDPDSSYISAEIPYGPDQEVGDDGPLSPLEDDTSGIPDIEDNSPQVNAGKGTDAQALALLKAKARLREINKHRNIGTINLSLGNPLVAAGQTMTLKGMGKYDGKWFVESIRHEIGGSLYTTALGVRRCLVGY